MMLLIKLVIELKQVCISFCALGINSPPLKNTTPFFCQAHLNLQTVQAPLYRQFPPVYWFL